MYLTSVPTKFEYFLTTSLMVDSLANSESSPLRWMTILVPISTSSASYGLTKCCEAMKELRILRYRTDPLASVAEPSRWSRNLLLSRSCGTSYPAPRLRSRNYLFDNRFLYCTRVHCTVVSVEDARMKENKCLPPLYHCP